MIPRTKALGITTIVVVLGALCFGCAATGHATASSTLGVSSRTATLDALIDEPGPIAVETITAATWVVDRSGLVDLTHPKAKAANLTDGPEPIALYVHLVRHPQYGTFMVDSGVEQAFVRNPDEALLHGLIGRLAHIDKLVVHRDTQVIVAATDLRGVFLTHLHLDHVLGLRDIPASTPVYVGAGEARASSFRNIFQRGIYDAALEEKGALREIWFRADPDQQFAGVLDVFGDASFFALSVPGHTSGSIAFIARTQTGPVLLTGDACHTAWGWRSGVGPGTFSKDVAESAEALRRLQAFAARHPKMDVRLGHQTLTQDADPTRAHR
jgi:N-acyl homoserine lactone hydrolase